MRILLGVLAIGMLSLCLAGCGCSVETAKRPNLTTDAARSDGETTAKSNTAGNSSAKDSGSDANKPFKLGDMIDPFTPPKLEDLEKSVQWVDMPVEDSLQLLRQRQANEKPLATIAEAMRLRNDSKENNEKIQSAFGRLPASDNDVNWDAPMHRHAYGDVNSTNPLLMSSIVEFDVYSLLAFGLFSFDWNMKNFAVKEFVVSWQASKDGMYDKIIMRDDMTWSDGKPITAHDVAYSFKVILTSAVPVPAVRQGTNQLKWVEAYDDRTLVYFHKEPLATNVMNVNFPVIAKHVYEDSLPKDPTMTRDPKHVELEDNPVSGGPYIIKSRNRGTDIVLERRESYYMHNGKQVRDKPYFKTIRFRIQADTSTSLLGLKAGDIDEIELTPEQFKTQSNDDEFYKLNTKAYATEWTSFHFMWNCKSPLFSDKRVRTAMSWAFDHEELLNTLQYGLCEPCTGNFHPTSKWAPRNPPKPYTQDLDKAEELLDQAGWKDSDGDGIRDKRIDGKKVDFKFTVITNNRPDRIDICQLLSQSLDQIGIKCEVSAMEFPVVIEKFQKHDFQAAFGGWGSGTDPDTSENIYATGQNRNYVEYSNPEVDKLFEAGRRELDPEKRPEIYRKIHMLLWEDQPYTWLFYRNSFYGFNKSLRGYVFSPRGPYHYGPGFSSIYKTAAP
jgi:peptide/nickel transport system substrate-binding protein